ncbi:MAG: DUF6161 domain-containing protein [Liquorilactobacillus hordei]|uniref:DUF6161 domain-containing protein n=1 Tax=Liquorilactobacillus hordei TaxID=468911 RepID=UPI0039EAF407
MEKIYDSDLMANILENQQIALKFNGIEVLRSRNLVEVLDKFKEEEKAWKEENNEEDHLQIYVELKEYRNKIETLIRKIVFENHSNVNIIFKSIRAETEKSYREKKYFSVEFYNGLVLDIKFPSLTGDSILAERILLGYKILKKSNSYEKFQYYVDLISHRSNARVTDYLNSNDENKILATSIYLKIMVNDNIPGPIVEGVNVNDLLKKIDKESAKLESSIVQERERFVQFDKELSSRLKNEGENRLEEYNNRLKQLENDTVEFLREKKNRMKELEDTYDTKLSLEEVAEFWSKEATKSKHSTCWWLVISVIISLFMIASGYWFLNVTQQDFSNNQITKIVPIYFAPLAVISLLIYLLRTTINIALSSRHVAIEYEQKNALTNYYLSMLQSGKIDDKEKSLVLPALFTKIDTGLNGKGNANAEDQLQSLIGLLLKQK